MQPLPAWVPAFAGMSGVVGEGWRRRVDRGGRFNPLGPGFPGGRRV